MPRRSLSLLIVLFWLGTACWLYYRDLRPGEPPPYDIDLADEVQTQGVPIHWKIFQDDQKIGSPIAKDARKAGTARTEVKYRKEEGTFELLNTFECGVPIFKDAVRAQLRLSSSYQLTPERELRGLSAAIDAELTIKTPLGSQTFPIAAKLEGPVREGFFEPVVRIEVPECKEIALQPVKISGQGGVLNPLHPVNRIQGLKAGMRWRMPLVDPLDSALAAALAEKIKLPPGLWNQRSLSYLDVEVLEEHQVLSWGGKEVKCLVIRYRETNEEASACTWVQYSDGLVLQQEVYSPAVGYRLILQRSW